MPSENDSEVNYELFEDRKAIKFMDNHSDDEIDKGVYYQLAIDPYKKQNVHLEVENALNVKKQGWAIIELYISSMNQLMRLK